MNTGLSKRGYVDGIFDKNIIDVWELETKKIVFSGSKLEVASFLDYSLGGVSQSIRLKSRIKKKKYTLRIRSEIHKP